MVGRCLDRTSFAHFPEIVYSVSSCFLPCFVGACVLCVFCVCLVQDARESLLPSPKYRRYREDDRRQAAGLSSPLAITSQTHLWVLRLSDDASESIDTGVSFTSKSKGEAGSGNRCRRSGVGGGWFRKVSQGDTLKMSIRHAMLPSAAFRWENSYLLERYKFVCSCVCVCFVESYSSSNQPINTL